MKRHTIFASAFLLTALAGCGGEATTADFCSTLDSEMQRFEAANFGPIESLFEMEVVTRRLADNAPPEIKEHAEILADTWEQAAAGAEPSLAGVASATQAIMRASNSQRQVDQFIEANC